MSKRICRDGNELSVKIDGKKSKYSCTRCDAESPKEKWCCKPKKL